MAISRLADDYEDAQLAFAQAGAIDFLVEAGLSRFLCFQRGSWQ